MVETTQYGWPLRMLVDGLPVSLALQSDGLNVTCPMSARSVNASEATIRKSIVIEVTLADDDCLVSHIVIPVTVAPVPPPMFWLLPTIGVVLFTMPVPKAQSGAGTPAPVEQRPFPLVCIVAL